jgi:hypothetical protein
MLASQPYGPKSAIAKLSENLVPVAIEGTSEMDGTETSWAIVLNPLCWGRDMVKSAGEDQQRVWMAEPRQKTTRETRT